MPWSTVFKILMLCLIVSKDIDAMLHCLQDIYAMLHCLQDIDTMLHCLQDIDARDT